ncbi:MAG TPA: protein kinase [Terriglobia bacterium]|nr:protein kinase [Terriglobia bacterium]
MQLKTCPTCHVSYPLEFEVCPQDGVRLESESGAAEAQTEWPTGKVVGGKYRISNRLGADEVAAIYEAHTLSLNAPRAIRVLQPRFAADARASEEFRRAADLVQKAAQANVIAVEGRGNAEDGRPFLVTEFFQSRALAELMQAEGPLEPQRACSIARQVALALSAAHRVGLLHLSLNPSNILVSGAPGEESVKVQGFGTAYVCMCWRRNGHSSSGATPRDYMPAGLRYASPEVALGTPPELLDERADLYSLGVVLYEMLTGRLPFANAGLGRESSEEPDLSTLAARLEGPPAPLVAGYDGIEVAAPLAAIVMALLERRPELRLPSARDTTEKMALAQSRIAALVRPGLRTAQAESMATRDSAEVGPPRTRDPARAEPAEMEGTRPALQSDLVAVPTLSAEAPLDSLDLKTKALSASVPPPAAVLNPEAAVASKAQTPDSRRFGHDTSVLFKTDRPPGPSRVGRWALAAVAMLVLAAGAWFFITRSRTQWLGAGPLSPIKSDELRSVEGASAPASSSSQATSKPAVQSQAGIAATGQPAQPLQQPVTQPSVSAPSASGPTSPVATVKELPARDKHSSGTPAAGTSTSSSVSPKPDGAPASTGTPLGPSPEDVASEVKRAIAAGDVFFELGQYDYAIRAYEGPLKDDPKNQELKLKIEHARKAKAAEEQYLGQ